MKFKKMEIYGFKSFADKVQIQFESGVTGIVGPNGCGKSNVADSIRWVLGEQSAKALRGSNMQDVIFNGTEKRKPQSFAEVSLYFDNTEKIFNVDYDEVVLTRKLYRSGESGYAINKTPCRLKDIQEILRDSGMGRESYSIIGQGRIDELLSAKPEDRRAVFEEAAGISKLKNRKLESLKKLNNTQDNLVRINDILHELEIQLAPLTSQAETAKKYLDLREKLKSLEINNYIYQYDSSASQKEEINNRLNGIVEEIDLKSKEFDETVDDYNYTANKIDSTDQTITRLRDELLNLTVGLEKQAGETKLLQEKINSLKASKERFVESVKLDQQEYDENKAKLESTENEKNLKEIVFTELVQKIDDLSSELDSLDREISSMENASEEETQKLVENLGKMGDIKAQITGLETEIKSIDARLAEVNTLRSECAEKYDIETDALNSKKREVEELEIKKTQKNEELKEKKQGNIKFAYKVAGLEEDLVDIDSEIRSLTGKINLMKEMQKENEGYVASVRKLLQDAKDNSTLGGKFVNVVAKLMSVPEKYETAIDMALGSAVQNVVTKNEDDAKYVIQYLKDNNIGRATFLPMTSIKPRKIADEFVSIIKHTNGAIGVATSLIEYDHQYDSVFNGLLGSTVIVENMDSAVNLAKSTRYSFKIVTLDGDVINPAGTMSGGSKKVQGVSLIGREREIVDTENRLIELRRRKEDTAKELEEAKLEQTAMDDELNKLNDEIRLFEIEIAKESENINKFKENLNQFASESLKLDETEEKLKSDKIASEEKLNAYKQFREDIESGNSPETALRNPELFAKKQKRNSISNELTELKVKKATCESDKVSLEAEILRLNDLIEKLNKDIRVAKLEIEKTTTDILEMEEEVGKTVDQNLYQSNMDALQKTRDELANFDVTKKELNKKLQDLSEKKLVLSSELQRANDRKYKEENLLVKIDSDIEQMQERVWEEYGLTYATAVEYKIENHNIQEGLQESARIKKQIQSLGSVNVNAIEMLTDVSSRFEDLSAQRDDLVNAENDLNKIIDGLTEEMETKFKTEFDKINTNFQGVFRELFGGGRAELKLSEPDNPLECGIEIAAEPTGKKLQNIQLLSGGERALTAIAILFAILKLKPMPFCVLDEIEAALDDANVERYARYLKRFSNYTQFIVITHRKPTMELADTLYGVTMEERGVSKVVSVQLAEAIKHTAKQN